MDRILRLPLYSAIALLVYMPFHVFLSQWLSTFTGGLDAWKIGKDIFLLVALLFSVALLIYKRQFENKYFWIFLSGALAYFLIHLFTWYGNPDIDNEAALLGTAYNCRLLGYAILAWVAALLYPKQVPVQKIIKILLIASTIVALLAVLQFALPKDIMTNFGYSLDRGVKPAFFIDDKADLPRAMSTLRDPNSLGAFLILPITILSLAWFRLKKSRLLVSGLLLLHALALFLTFSRSAWLGTAMAVLGLMAWVYKKEVRDFAKKYKYYLAAGIFVMLLGTFLLRDQYFVQNVVFHADENTQLADPNELRVGFFQKITDEIVEQPFGHGPGTAGLVSIQTDKVVLTENYFLQIAYEVGVQGLILLVTLMYFVCILLFRQKTVYSKILLASFAGITISAMLLHAWSNEAVSCQWWLLAGILLGLNSTKRRGTND
jgi:hypothetical protein